MDTGRFLGARQSTERTDHFHDFHPKYYMLSGSECRIYIFAEISALKEDRLSSLFSLYSTSYHLTATF